MTLGFHLVGNGFNPLRLATETIIDLKQEGFDWSFASLELNFEVTIAGITEETFFEIANAAEITCPVSMPLSAIPIHLNAKPT
jgi:organic hydroperoxide reductase OsmC/OhrA